jgi:hypothetical protein
MKKKFLNLAVFQIILSSLLLFTGNASAFDTGHHADLTREALEEVGMSNTSVEVCQVENWLVDYYSQKQISPRNVYVELAKLHADNLFSEQAVVNYWNRYAINARKAFQDAARSNNPKQVLALLGMSLHSVQDFYSHSNWAEINPAPSGVDYATVTLFDNGRRNGVRTGRSGISGNEPEHGGYYDGMNHDSYGRLNWDKAYVFAYAASRQWVNQAKIWVSEVNPGVWEQAKNISLTSKQRSRLASDLNASYRMSEWVKYKTDDGHWKGPGSGSLGSFSSFSAAWIAFTQDSIFVEDFKNRKWHQLLSGGLNGALDLGVNAPPSTPVPSVAFMPMNKKAIFLKTVSVRDLNRADRAPSGDADMYAKISIGNQLFVEAMQLNKKYVEPAWTTIKFVEDTNVVMPVHYELWDEDGGITGGDDHLDIRPGSSKNLDFVYNLNTHQISDVGIKGIYDKPSQLFTSRGTDKNRAELQFYITTKTLAKVVRRTQPPIGADKLPTEIQGTP